MQDVVSPASGSYHSMQEHQALPKAELLPVGVPAQPQIVQQIPQPCPCSLLRAVRVRTKRKACHRSQSKLWGPRSIYHAQPQCTRPWAQAVSSWGCPSSSSVHQRQRAVRQQIASLWSCSQAALQPRGSSRDPSRGRPALQALCLSLTKWRRQTDLCTPHPSCKL